MSESVSWKDKFDRIQRRMDTQEERNDEMIAVGIDTIIMHITGGAVAFLHGRKGGMPAVARMPVDALAAGVGNLIGWGCMAYGFRWGRHIVAAANGPSLWWTGGMMAKWGKDIRKKKGEQKGPDAIGPTAEQQEEAGIQWRSPVVFGERNTVPSNTNAPRAPHHSGRMYGNSDGTRKAA